MAGSLRVALPFALFAVTLACGPAFAGGGPGAAPCAPRVVDGWLRLPPMPMPMLAGFGKIENPCTVAVAVTAAHSPAFGSVELHQTTVVDGVSRMRPVPELRIPAGGSAELRPGGLHLMLMRPVSPLQQGDRARVELELSDGRRIGADFEVRAASAR